MSFDPILLAYTGIGAIGGLVAGLFGIGGGSVFGPLLLVVFTLQGLDSHTATVAAVSTSIATIMIATLPSAIVYAYHRNIQWPTLMLLAPPALVGGVAGAQIAQMISPILLLAAMLAILLRGIHSILSGPPRKASGNLSKNLGYKVRISTIGGLAGLAGSVTGMGGGILASPLLHQLGLPLRVCIGTSSAMTLIVAFGSTISFAGNGIVLPALVSMSTMCFLCSALGARLTSVMPLHILRPIFGCYMIFMACHLAYWIVERSLGHSG